MKLRFTLATLCLVIMGVVVGNVSAESKPTALGEVASAFASRPVAVVCRSMVEDPTFVEAWGYVYAPAEDQYELYMHQTLCRSSLAVDLDAPGVSDRYKALGAAVLTHEAYHLRRLPLNNNEAKTECRAMRHYDVALALLGAEPETITRLLPLMLKEHFYLIAQVPAYGLKGCSVPARYGA